MYYGNDNAIFHDAASYVWRVKDEETLNELASASLSSLGQLP